MSAFDELYQKTLDAHGRGEKRANWRHIGDSSPTLGPVATFDVWQISKALEAARQSEGQPLPEQYVLPDYPGQSAVLRIDGDEVGSHGLTVIEGETCYQATSRVDGVTPALQVRPRGWFRPTDDEGRYLASYGEIQRTGSQELDHAVMVRGASRRAAVVFLTPELIEALVRLGSKVVSVSVRPEAGGTFVETLVEVKSAPKAEPAIVLARAAHAAMVKLVSTPGGFAETAEATVLGIEEIRALVTQVKDSVSFLAGHVERVGDGVEARLELDQPTGLHAVLRIEPTGARELRATFRGDIPLPQVTRETRLSPQVGFLKKVKGLADPKVGDPLLDNALLIEGDVTLARLVLSDGAAALRLAGRGASLALDGAGLHVRVPRLPLEGDALLEGVIASVALWREAVLKCAGFSPDARQE